jgi:hypothetical protein
MSTAHARRFSPIFSATVIPDKVEPRIAASGEAYTRMSATLRRPGKPDMKRTVMAFGKPNMNLRHLLVPGQAVELAIQLNGGSAKIIGLPRPADVDFEQASYGNEAPTHAIEEIAAVLMLLDVDASLHESIINEMFSGESERPAEDIEEDVSEIASLVHEQQGHILVPLLNAGIDYRTACRAVDLIRDLDASAALDDARTLREQTAVHALLAAA